MISKVSVHCLDLECDSENIVMLNATVHWNFQFQQWVYNENPQPLFLCTDCSVESEEIIWRAETDILGHALTENKENNNA